MIILTVMVQFAKVLAVNLRIQNYPNHGNPPIESGKKKVKLFNQDALEVNITNEYIV
jgi:hypothetical protein